MKTEPLSVVTGASAGLGREFARQLVAKGRRVLAVARREERLNELAEESGGSVIPLALDLTARGAAREVHSRAAELGATDLLVNNAGFGGFGPFIDRDLETLQRMMRLNMEVLVELTHLFLPQMVERDAGGIINVASTTAFQPVPYVTMYAATKAFVLSFTEGVAEELSDTNVRVLASCPGTTRTEFHAVSSSGTAAKLSPIWMEADEVVRQALDALAAGQVVKVHGAANAASIIVSRRTPKSWVRRWLGRKIRGRIQRG